jgi:hypothetical protein
MKCPVCKERTLINHDLGENLLSLECESCGGRWIKAWIDGHPQRPTLLAFLTTPT